jgi:S-DNA-T family DNA segregation ATPase FtsK/SpoIIIE
VLAVISSLALATWSVQDPSFSHATNAPIRNLLGAPGAVASDLLIQIFGLASIVIMLPLAVWGWRLITHRRVRREWLRLLF